MEEEERSPQEILSAVVARAMEAKYELCVENKGIVDAPPLLIGELPNGDGFLMPDLLEGHPTDSLPLMLGALGEGMATLPYGVLALPLENWRLCKSLDQ